MSYFLGNSPEKAKYLLVKSEVEALESFLEEIFQDLDDLYVDQDALLRAQTFQGRLMNHFAYIFSFICIFKVISASI